MAEDDKFEPRLGRMRAAGGRGQKRFLHRILAAANLARGGPGAAAGRPGFTGRHARGAGVGRVLGAHDRLAANRARRVVVKSRIVRLAGKGGANARAHLRYLQRDGTTREGQPGALYGPEQEVADGKAFLERGAGDRHQFRLIVSPEDGDAYPDLRSVTRRLLAQMEEDLGTRLDWVAVDHFNTGHPHSHILLRGTDERGRDLVMARDYLARGIRARAGEILDMDLGPRTDREIATRMRAEVEQDRFTGIDHKLLASRSADGLVDPSARTPLEQSLRSGRLAKLQRMGLAEPDGSGRWRLAADLEDTLRAIGERGDILKTLHRTLAEQGLHRAAGDRVRFAPEWGSPLVGKVLERGLSDELRDRHYLIIDGLDGRTHHVELGAVRGEDGLGAGSIVRISPALPEIRAADRTIRAIADANAGRYSIDLHLRYDPNATERFATSHVRRLEAMRRAGHGVERRADGSWQIPANHLEEVAAYEARLARAHPVKVEILSRMPVERLPDFDGETWVDRRLAGLETTPVRNAGFGAELIAAEQRRRTWLEAEGLCDVGDTSARLSSEALAVLRRRELLRVASQLSEELRLPFAETPAGGHVEGTLQRRVDLGSRSAGLVLRGRDFTLVPWRPTMEARIGQRLTGRATAAGFDWTLAPARGPSIS